MKRITFALLLAVLFIGNFSCTDHSIPPVPPIIETLEFQFLSDDWEGDREWDEDREWEEDRQINFDWFLEFNALGTIGISEYGIAYSSNISPSEIINKSPMVGDSLTHLIPFSAAPIVSSPLQQTREIGIFDVIFYRAYAKLDNGDIIYGRILSNED